MNFLELVCRDFSKVATLDSHICQQIEERGWLCLNKFVGRCDNWLRVKVLLKKCANKNSKMIAKVGQKV